ncbi:hypothetical protein RGQ13_05445 [Thalassotalea psychrophila]|uniref:Alkaline phytoceramidase n=1 Tax=Thalassotalea psychrophila TaxID=3065647 RepID=A0ABY9TX89_9GAMM|nr:hypothetical protein RGQ13_05445 [Colwelliaceae bacterium SQ149]
MNKKYLILSIFALAIYLLVVPPLAQDLQYHQFADQQTLLFIPNALNVLSNAAFFIVGLIGITALLNQPDKYCDKKVLPSYQLFFVGLMLTSLGSGYYHLEPNNFTLVFDRLAIAISFMALFTALFGELISLKLANKMLMPLVALGTLGVVYWAVSEQYMYGDMRLYLLTQYLPLALLPFMLIKYKWRYSHQYSCIFILLFYVLAKFTEVYDQPIMELTGGISGHTIKHLLAALSGYWVYWLLKNRKVKN